MNISENEPRVLVFVDILGFGDLTEKYQFRLQEFRDERYSVTSTTEMQSQFNRFDRVLDQCMFDETLSGGIHAMLFSDCAYFVFTKTFETELLAVRAAMLARKLMRNFINNHIPVRMGIGKGTFYDFEHSTKTNVKHVMVSKSRFVGTAVVRAHGAEHCGGKGMRIFLDESMGEDLPYVGPWIPLAKPLKRVKWELNYLYEPRPGEQQEAEDQKLFENVLQMKSPEMPQNVQLQYKETLDALNRMRISSNRKTVDLQRGQRTAN